MPALPDLRLASFATGTWLASVAALYMSARGGVELAVGGAAVALVLAVGPMVGTASAPGRRRRRLAVARARLAQTWARLDTHLGLTCVRLDRLRVPAGLDLSAARWMFVAAAIGVVCGAVSTASHVSIQ